MPVFITFVLENPNWNIEFSFPRLFSTVSNLSQKGNKKKFLDIIKNLKLVNLFKLLRYTDYILFVIVISFFIIDLVNLLAYFVDMAFPYYECFLQMNNNSGMPNNYGFIGNSAGGGTSGGNPGGFPQGNPGPFTTHSTNVNIIHNDGSWSSAIRNLFIYGSGGARLWMSLSRGGTPTQRFFIMSSTILADAASKVLHNSINDPNYVGAHMSNFKTM
jgi:hypothetical protein